MLLVENRSLSENAITNSQVADTQDCVCYESATKAVPEQRHGSRSLRLAVNTSMQALHQQPCWRRSQKP